LGALTIRQATASDVPNIAEVHVRSWQAAYRGVLADDLPDSLSVAEREGSWRALLVLGNAEHHWLNLVAENGNGGLIGFCAVTTPSHDAKRDESLAEVGALYVDPDRWREGAGAAMLIAAFEKLKERSWREVVLWVCRRIVARSPSIPVTASRSRRESKARGAQRATGHPAARQSAASNE
jgi:predicted N-acetyltransferase YhbS